MAPRSGSAALFRRTRQFCKYSVRGTTRFAIGARSIKKAGAAIERHMRPRLLSYDKRFGGDADLTAKRPVKIDYEYHHQRECGREYAGHHHVHSEVLVAKEICVAGSNRSAEEYYPPD